MYRISLSCGRLHIRQKGHYINDRIRERSLAVFSKRVGDLDFPCRSCRCVLQFQKISAMARAWDKAEREIIEAFFIRQSGDKCVRTPSVSVTDREIAYLDGPVRSEHTEGFVLNSAQCFFFEIVVCVCTGLGSGYSKKFFVTTFR